jgi:tetratricopeptide (TPR) repeat protein
VEASLRAAIRINPAFAPAYSSLAMWYRMRDENLEEAHQLALKAVDLEPGNFQYVYNTANLLLRMKQTENAERVAEKALSLANSAEERFAAQALVDNVRRYQQSLAMREQARERRKAAEQEEPQLHARSAETGPVTTPAPLETQSKRAPETPVTAATVEGKVTEASCTPSGVMKLTLALPHYDLDLHAQDYRHVEFHGANPMPGGSGNPCRSLQGVNARVTFKPDAGAGEIVSIDVQK